MKWLTLTLSVLLLLKMTISSEVEIEEAVDNEVSSIQPKFATMKMGGPRVRNTLVRSQIEEVLKLWRKNVKKLKAKKMKRIKSGRIPKKVFPGSPAANPPNFKKELPGINTKIKKPKTVNPGSVNAKVATPGHKTVTQQAHKPATPEVKAEKGVDHLAPRESKTNSKIASPSQKKIVSPSNNKKHVTKSKISESKEKISLRKGRDKIKEKKKPPLKKKERKEKQQEKSEKKKYKPKMRFFRKSARPPPRRGKTIKGKREPPTPELGEGI